MPLKIPCSKGERYVLVVQFSVAFEPKIFKGGYLAKLMKQRRKSQSDAY
jgi:uncharacterized protein YebE (UPF0316 family)